MKDYEFLSSGRRVDGARPMSNLDFRMMSTETASRKEAVSKAVEAITMLATRIVTVDACIGIMKKRAPFASLDRSMAKMSRLCEELTEECMKVYGFCITDNVLAMLDCDKDERNPEDDVYNGVDLAADAPGDYGGKP